MAPAECRLARVGASAFSERTVASRGDVSSSAARALIGTSALGRHRLRVDSYDPYVARDDVHGLSIVGARLWLRARRRRRPRLRFEPGGLVVATGAGETFLDWDLYLDSGGGDRWRCSGHPGSRYSRPAVSVYLEHPPPAPYTVARAEEWSVPSPWLTLRYAWDEAPALAEYAARTPAARSGLGREHSLARLLADLGSRPLFERSPPEHHLMGDKLDIDIAIEKVFARCGVRRFGGRPVCGEPLPTVPDLVAPVRDALPGWVHGRVHEAQIEKQVARLLNVRPWPFGCLIDAQHGSRGAASDSA